MVRKVGQSVAEIEYGQKVGQSVAENRVGPKK
jgi:hypothetical protein